MSSTSFREILRQSLRSMNDKQNSVMPMPVILSKYVNELDWRKLASMINEQTYDLNDTADNIDV